MKRKVARKQALVLVGFIIALFLFPLLLMVFEPSMEPRTFDTIGTYWKYGGSAAFLVILFWVLLTGEKD